VTITDAPSARLYAGPWLAALHAPSPLLAARFMRDSKGLRHASAICRDGRSRGFADAADVLEAASNAALGIRREP
jgi:hypothetical protein